MCNAGYLFEGHLTVDREPPQPAWLVQSNLLTAAAALLHGESSAEQQTGSGDTGEDSANLLHQLVNSLDDILPEVSSFFFFLNKYFLRRHRFICLASLALKSSYPSYFLAYKAT